MAIRALEDEVSGRRHEPKQRPDAPISQQKPIDIGSLTMKSPQIIRGKPQTIVGKLSGKKITIPNVNAPPMPSLASPGVIHNGKKPKASAKSILLGDIPT